MEYITKHKVKKGSNNYNDKQYSNINCNNNQ